VEIVVVGMVMMKVEVVRAAELEAGQGVAECVAEVMVAGRVMPKAVVTPAEISGAVVVEEYVAVTLVS